MCAAPRGPWRRFPPSPPANGLTVRRGWSATTASLPWRSRDRQPPARARVRPWPGWRRSPRSCWQLLGERLHPGHGRTRALAGGWRSLDLHGRLAVVALQPRRTVSPFAGGEGGNRRHGPRGAAHIKVVQIFRLGAIGRVGLDKDLLHPAPIDELVDIGAAERRADRGVDIGLRK